MEAAICYRLDLVIRLVDTTVGSPVTERQVLFRENGRMLSFLSRGAGTYVLVNGERKKRQISIAVRGYLETTADICYEALTGRYPEVYVELIPERPKYGGWDFMDISGNLPGISSVAAVCLTAPSARAVSYNAEKRQMRILPARELNEKTYALIHSQTDSFEEFCVASVKKKVLLRLEHPLETAFQPEEEIARIVRGRTETNGNYLLRLRGDGQGLQYLIRYVVNGKTNFRRAAAGNADDPENRRLQDGSDGGDGSVLSMLFRDDSL